MCPTAFGTGRTVLWFGIEAELAQKTQLRHDVVGQIDVKEPGENIGVGGDQIEIRLVLFRKLDGPAMTYFVTGEDKLREKVRAELQFHFADPLTVDLRLGQ